VSILSRCSLLLTLICPQGKDLKMRIGAKTAKLEWIVTFALALVVSSPVVMAAIAVI
jgi:hypothetical protein